LETIQLIVLALVQGLTEFLPISSSAHLILPSKIFNWQDQGLAFDVAVHVGTLVAVIWYFRSDLNTLLKGFCCSVREKKNSSETQLVIALVIGTLPAVLMGYFCEHWIKTWLRSPLVIAWTTIIFGVLLGLADKFGRSIQPLDSMTWRAALLIGLAQALALIPGTSRSGVTMTAALFLGFSRTASARFSFLLSIPIIAGAGLLQVIEVVQTPGSLSWSIFVVGALLSAASAYICIRLFLVWIEQLGMWPFVIYRLLLGGLLLLLF